MGYLFRERLMIKSSIFKSSLLILAFISSGTYAAERVMEDSLVYDDPTVAKPGKWVGGISADIYRFTSPVAASNNSGQSVPATEKLVMPGMSGYFGYGDFTLMASYRQGQSTTQFGSPVSNSSQTTTYETEFDLRYLITPLAMKYFVPYVIAGYVNHRENDYVSGASLNGVGEHNHLTLKGPAAGIGGIIPITEKYGFRIDERFVNANNTNVSNIYPGLNFSTHANVNVTTVTVYYNVTNNINAQIGFKSQQVHQTNNNSTTNGAYATIGYSFN